MSPSKARCGRCRELTAECVCLEDGALFPVASADSESCRFCGQVITMGRRGYQAEDGELGGYACPDAPLGFHSAAVKNREQGKQ